MRRFLFFAAGFAFTVGGLVASACSDTSASALSDSDAGSLQKDGSPVLPSEAGAYDAATPQGPLPSCATYCNLVMGSCTGDFAQYASAAECNELCAKLPTGDAGDDESNTVACRQYYAGTPAKTSPESYCVAAGPFGGMKCGERCPIFCELALGSCSPEAGVAPFDSYSDCQQACSGFNYKDGGTGGGDHPDGPATGDTLNCRLFHLRAAVHDGSGCVDLGVDSGACR
jgi:hypothetical protein